MKIKPFQIFILCFSINLVFTPLIAEEGVESTSIESRLAWFRLRELQSEYSNEVALSYRHLNSDSELGNIQSLKLRQYTNERISLIGTIQNNLFKSKVLNLNENITTLSLGLIANRLDGELYAQIGTGHGGRVDGKVSWQKGFKQKGAFVIDISREAQKSSLASLRYEESQNRLKTQVSFQLPSDFFLIAESSLYSSYLRKPILEKGNGQSHNIILGFRLHEQPNRKLEGFFDGSLRFNSPLRQYIYFALTQQVQKFEASSTYLSKIAPAKKSTEQKALLELGLPLTPHFGCTLSSSIGQDHSRDLGFAKIINIKSLFMWIPTFRCQYVLENKFSTENTGRIKGNLLESTISIHVNI